MQLIGQEYVNSKAYAFTTFAKFKYAGKDFELKYLLFY